MKNEIKNLIIIIILSFIIRILLIDTATVEGDMNFWTTWTHKLLNSGFANFYVVEKGGLQTDYLPGYMYILWFAGNIQALLANWGITVSDHFIFKIPAILADLGSTVVIYQIVKKYFNGKTAVKAAALYAFNPAIFANSAMWGQVDGFQAFFLLLVLWLFIENNLFLASAFFAYAVLIKPTSIFLLPIVLFIAYQQFPKINIRLDKFNIVNYIEKLWVLSEFKRALLGLCVFFLIIFALTMPFSGAKAPWNFIVERFASSIDQYKYASLNAFDYWALAGKMWQDDSITQMGITLKQWGLIMFGGVSLITLFFLHKYRHTSKNRVNIILASAIIFAGAFDLLTRAHERHLLIALPFLAILAVVNRKFLIAYIITSAVYFANLYFAYVWLTTGVWMVFDQYTINLLSALNIVVLIFLMLEISIPENEHEATAAHIS